MEFSFREPKSITQKRKNKKWLSTTFWVIDDEKTENEKTKTQKPKNKKWPYISASVSGISAAPDVLLL
jgi:hypothetical protein